MSNKIYVEAILSPVTDINKKEIATSLKLPENKQKDLLFMSAILVSTGTNKNGATFLGSELIKARGTITQKALDLEHKEDQVVGHIVSNMYLDQAGKEIQDEELLNKLNKSEGQEKAKVVKELDGTPMDIGIVCVVYKDRFPEIAKEIVNGGWKVSMECYYEDYDLKIGDLIIPREDASKFKALDEKFNNDLKLVVSGKSLGTQRVSRILRTISFCGCGIVKNPANDRSIILEAATDNIRKTVQRENLEPMAASAEVFSVSKTEVDKLDKVELKEDTAANEVVQIKATGYFLLKEGTEVVKDSFRLNYNDIAKEAIRRASLDHNKHSYYIVATNSKLLSRQNIEINDSSEAVTIRTDDIGDVLDITAHSSSEKELSYADTRFGPKDQPAGICISFEKYVKQFPGHANPGRILATHWCKLFNKPCPVFGASALDTACLRNKYSHLTRIDNMQNDELVQTTFNPVQDPKTTVMLKSEDQPAPKPANEAIQGKPVLGTPYPESKIVQPKVVEVDLNKVLPITQEKTALDQEHPDMNMPKSAILNDFPIRVANASHEERKALKNSQFALPDDRRYPINSKERAETLVAIFPKIVTKLELTKQIELANNLYTACAVYDIDVNHLEKEISANQGVKVYTSEYAVPRLKLFPLTSREQVIAAMSKFRHMKAELSDNEKKHLVINILRAAKKFNVNASMFRERVIKILSSIYE